MKMGGALTHKKDRNISIQQSAVFGCIYLCTEVDYVGLNYFQVKATIRIAFKNTAEVKETVLASFFEAVFLTWNEAMV